MGPFGALFLSLPVLLRWPDELGREQNELVGIDQIAAMWRCDQYRVNYLCSRVWRSMVMN